MSLPGMDERFLAADSRVAEWSMGGAMFGLTAAVVQMLIRSLIVKRDNVSRDISLVVISIHYWSVSAQQESGEQEDGREEEVDQSEKG